MNQVIQNFKKREDLSFLLNYKLARFVFSQVEEPTFRKVWLGSSLTFRKV